MSRYYVPLPQPEIRNSLIDFAPLNRGIDAVGEARQQARTNALADERMKMAKDQQAYQRGRDQRQDARDDAQWYGKAAMAVDRMQGPERAAAWQKIIARHGADGLTPDEMDPIKGPKMLMAQAGMSVDPMEARMNEAKLGLIHAQTAQANQRADQSKIVEVNGRVVRVPQHGMGEVVYEAQAQEGRGFKDAKQQFDVEQGLRKEFTSQAKPYFEVRDAYNRVEQSAKAPSAAGDLALIFNYMKMLDPGSVVREGEFATAQNAAGVPDRIRGYYNRIINGERLSEPVRADFVGQARGLYKVQADQYQALQSQYRDISKRSGANPENTILDYRRQADVKALTAAKEAISKGADPAAVRKRLIENGIDPGGL